MKRNIMLWAQVVVFCLAIPEGLLAANTTTGGIPDWVQGPLKDNTSNESMLYGDLCKVLRYRGGELYDKVEFIYDSKDRITGFITIENSVAVGGEPVLSMIGGYYAAKSGEGESETYEAVLSDIPSQCIQPVADYARWGVIDTITGLSENRLPLIITYDETWGRSECDVGKLKGEPEVDPETGAFITPLCADADDNDCIEPYFIWPGDTFAFNGATYCDGVLWGELVDEVSFGRLSSSRSPETVLQAAFDEAITAINNAESIARDAAGRLVLTTPIFEEFRTVTITDENVEEVCVNRVVDILTKTIDSPIENLALYVKLMQDGHLVTPGDERAPIDQSGLAGIPLWMLLGLSDGPSDALRPTVDINKLYAAYPDLAVTYDDAVDYYTYYECYKENGNITTCLCEEEAHDGTITTVACDDVFSRRLVATLICPDGEICGGPWNGILSDTPAYEATGKDFDFAASFLAAAMDKGSKVDMDMVVYINSILGINLVIGYSAYNAEGTPTSDAIDYSRNPVYFDFSGMPLYDRTDMFDDRGNITALVPESNSVSWVETTASIETFPVIFNDLGLVVVNDPDGEYVVEEFEAEEDVLGFCQRADDDLGIIEFIHEYQIPEDR